MILECLLLSVVTLSQATELHHHMNEEEIQTIFRVARNAVPDYEVVPVFHTLHKRNAGDDQVVKFTAFGNDVELKLIPNSGILYGNNTPVFTVVPDNTKPFGVNFTKIINPYEGIGLPYLDEQTMSAIIMKKDLDGYVQISGIILDDYIIQPVPARLNNLIRNTRSVNETDDSFEQTHHHIIFKQPNPTKEELQRGIQLVKPQYPYQHDSRTGRSQRDVSGVAYPEILVTMDYSLYITQPDFKTAVTYLMAFWNAVDLRFKLLTQPRIELNIAAFIISIQNGGTPFIMGTGNESRLVNTSDALGAMRKFFYPDGKIPVNYDIAIAMTQLDLYFGAFVRVITGMAYVAAPCNLSPSENEIFSLAIVEDNGAFRNVLMAAHELGHLLGADHDGEKENKNCTGNQGLLMSPAIGFLEEYYYWSDCSIHQIRKLMNSKLAACLFNVPQPGRPPQALLPGEVKSLDEQCQIAVGTNVCRHKMENICETLWCLDPEKEGSCVNPSAAAEGSICGDYKHCMSGMCVGTLGMSILVHKHSSR